METKGNTVIITGGSSKIGFALARKFASLGNTVVICGKNEAKLSDMKSKVPRIHTIRCNVSREDERKFLCEEISKSFPEANILINNAGIQRSVDLT